MEIPTMPHRTNQGHLILMFDAALTTYQSAQLARLVREAPGLEAEPVTLAGPHLPTTIPIASSGMVVVQQGPFQLHNLIRRHAWHRMWVVKDGLVWCLRLNKVIANLNARPHRVRLHSLSAARALEIPHTLSL